MEKDTFICRICLQEDVESNLLSPCACRGSCAFVHQNCLLHWILLRKTDSCLICTAKYDPFIMEKCSTNKMQHLLKTNPIGVFLEILLYVIFMVIFILFSFINVYLAPRSLYNYVIIIIGSLLMLIIIENIYNIFRNDNHSFVSYVHSN